MNSSQRIDSRGLVACHECDRLHRKPLPGGGQVASCSQCGCTLARGRHRAVDRTLALSIAGLACLIVANLFPFIAFDFEGRSQSTTIFAGVTALAAEGLYGVAALIFVAAIGAPLLKLVGMIYVLLPLRFGKRPYGLATSYRWLERLHPWAMAEVYLLGVLVAFVKLSDMARVELAVAFYAFCALILLSTAANATMDPREVWSQLEDLADEGSSAPGASA